MIDEEIPEDLLDDFSEDYTVFEVGRTLGLYEDQNDFKNLVKEAVADPGSESKYKIDLNFKVYEKLCDGLGYEDWTELDEVEKDAEIITRMKRLVGEVDSITEASKKISDEVEYSPQKIRQVMKKAPKINRELKSNRWLEMKRKQYMNWRNKYCELNEDTMGGAIDKRRDGEIAEEEMEFAYNPRTTEEIAEEERKHEEEFIPGISGSLPKQTLREGEKIRDESSLIESLGLNSFQVRSFISYSGNNESIEEKDRSKINVPLETEEKE
ncbi:MAG: hypothetical protein ACLFS3_02465 [Candidatus Aenigmatarchaeota archaeon]